MPQFKFQVLQRDKTKILISLIAKEDNILQKRSPEKHRKDQAGEETPRGLLSPLVQVVAGNEQVWSWYSMLLNTSILVKVYKQINERSCRTWISSEDCTA